MFKVNNKDIVNRFREKLENTDFRYKSPNYVILDTIRNFLQTQNSHF